MEQVFVELTEWCIIKDEWEAGTVRSERPCSKEHPRRSENPIRVIPASQQRPLDVCVSSWRAESQLTNYAIYFLPKKGGFSNGFPFLTRNIDRFFRVSPVWRFVKLHGASFHPPGAMS